MIYKDFLLIFLEGVLAFISPCFLPMLPVYFSYLGGQKKEDNKLIYNSLGFTLGFTVIFVILGLGATTFSKYLQAHRDLILKIGGVILILLGINMTEIIKIGVFNKDTRNIKAKPVNSLFEAFLFGIAIAFGWSPCLGSFLTAALIKASNGATTLEGGLLLLTFSLGLAIPLIITAVLFNNLKEIFNLIKKNYKIINLISGIFLIIMGLLMIFNKFTLYTNIFY